MNDTSDNDAPTKNDDLVALLERIRATDGDGQEVTVGEILKAAGTRTFGPVVVVAGLVVLAPLIGDIPGVPTLMGLLVLLTVGQMLFRKRELWLPRWSSR